MFFKILSIVQIIASLVLEAEGRFPAGAGGPKKDSVMKSAGAELRKDALFGAVDETIANKLLDTVGCLVDGVVGLFNLTGAFSHAPGGGARTPTPTETEPPSSE